MGERWGRREGGWKVERMEHRQRPDAARRGRRAARRFYARSLGPRRAGGVGWEGGSGCLGEGKGGRG